MFLSQSEIKKFLNSGCLISSPSSDEITIGWGSVERTQSSLKALQEKRISIYAPDFFLEDQAPWWVFENFVSCSRAELLEALKSLVQSFCPIQWSQVDFDSFQETFYDIKKKLKEGLLKKAVPLVFQTAQFSIQNMKPLLISHLLKNTKGVPVSLYGVWNAEEGILGATPETLFQAQRRGSLWTMALAGTRTSDDSRVSLLQDPKELEEHRIVIEGICSSFQSDPQWGKIQVGQTKILKLPTLSHLMTPIEIQIPEDKTLIFEEGVRCLHPTPALGAFPKNEGMKWLQELNKKRDRCRFGAPFGVLKNFKESLCLVGIRNLQWFEDEVSLIVGCGIIEASHLDQEWKELQSKQSAVKALLGLS